MKSNPCLFIPVKFIRKLHRNIFPGVYKNLFYKIMNIKKPLQEAEAYISLKLNCLRKEMLSG